MSTELSNSILANYIDRPPTGGLLLFAGSFQRIEIRCYKIGRGYASIL
jgi:hypothetical protein